MTPSRCAAMSARVCSNFVLSSAAVAEGCCPGAAAYNTEPRIQTQTTRAERAGARLIASPGHLERDRRHVVVRRRVGAEFLHGGKNRIDQGPRRLVARLTDHVEQTRRSKLASQRVVRFKNAVRAEHIDVARREIERHLVVGGSGERSERHARKLDL